MLKDDKEDAFDRELDELDKELEEEDEEYEWLEENEPQETENPEEKENLEESEANPETIAEFLKAEEEETIRAKKLKVLDNILKEQADTEFFSFLHEHRELENLLKMFVFALTQIAEGTADNFTATAKREADIVKVEYEFFDSDGNKVYFERDGTISKIFSSEREQK